MLLMHGNESVSHYVDPELARHLTSSQTVSWHVLNFFSGGSKLFESTFCHKFWSPNFAIDFSQLTNCELASTFGLLAWRF